MQRAALNHQKSFFFYTLPPEKILEKRTKVGILKPIPIVRSVDLHYRVYFN